MSKFIKYDSTLTDVTSFSANFDTRELSGLIFSSFTINNYNSITLTFPEITATGSIDIIPMNAAGYGSLVNDIGTTITIN